MHNQRFFSYLSLFTFMMIILVTANNFLLMFVGWEGVGICSYLLVSFWFTRIAANQSSISAFLTNRVGDCFLTIGMFAILWSFGNIDYYTVFSLAPYYSENVITIVGICLLIGAMAKSSQVGLHVWLPMAMEGPTPVSALIHAATMVTAGVYLLMRASPLIEYSSTVLIFCLWVGAITTVFSSLVGLFQQDIKKVIAYSTMSQLGMMVIAVGLSSYNIALFHLVNHAFYKALLFLGAGAVIHAVADNQDFRKYGGLISYLPLTYSVMLIASLSLVAIPFMSGFYSKDLILESAYGQYHLYSVIVYYIATIGAMFTTLYSVKILYLTFLSYPNGPLINYKRTQAAQEGDIYMNMPLIILAIFSIFFGYLTKDIFIGLASGFFSDNSLFIHPLHEIMLDTEFAVPALFKLLPLFFTISLSLISLLFTEFFPKLLISFKFSSFGYNIFSFFNQRFFVELFYNKYISGIILKLGGQTIKVLDKGLVELIGPYGLERNLTNLSRNINNLSTGIVTSYALYILIGLITYVCVLYYSNFVENFLNLLLLTLFSLISFEENYSFGYVFLNLKLNLLISINKVFNKVHLKKFFSWETFFLLILYNIMGIAIRIICIKLGIVLPIKSFFLYMLFINSSSIVRCYANIVIDSIFIYKGSKKIACNKYIGKIFTRYTFFKLIINFFINLTFSRSFIFIDNNYIYLSCLVFIEIIDGLLKYYINLESFFSFNICITKYLDPIFNLYILNNSTCNLIFQDVPRLPQNALNEIDNTVVFMQEKLGKISVATRGNNGIYSFNNKIITYNFTPSYYTIDPQDRAFYTNILFCLEARKGSHQYVVNSLRTQIKYILNTFNPDTKTIKDFPADIRRNMNRTMKLSYSFTTGDTEVSLINDNKTLTQLRGDMETIRSDVQRPLTSLESAIWDYKDNFYGDKNNSIAGRAIKAHRENVIKRAKDLTFS